MTRPAVSPTAEELYASLGAYAVGDEDQDWHLLLFCEALCAAFVEPIAELVSERDGRVPWEGLFSPADCPVEFLPWLAQWTGSTLTSGMTEAEMRAAITLPAGWRRGTLDALTQAVERTLTDSKTVHVDERYGDAAYQLRVRTLATETPDAAATEAAVRSQKPIGISLMYDAIVSQDWDDLVADHSDWDAVIADYPTWAGATLDLP